MTNKKKCEKFRTFFCFDTSCQNRPVPLHRESNIQLNNKRTMIDAIILIVSSIVVLVISIGIVVAVGYAALFIIGAMIGGILTLIDKYKTLK